MANPRAEIETWYLAGNGIGPGDMGILADALEGNVHARALWLKRNPLGTEGAGHLGRLLAKNRTLRLLDVHNTGLFDEGVEALARAFESADGALHLRHLYASANALSERSLEALRPVLTKARSAPCSLVSLSLSLNRFGNGGLDVLVDILETGALGNLERLDLGSVGLEGPDLSRLTRALVRHCAKLRSLDLGTYLSTRDLGEKTNRLDPDVTQARAPLARASGARAPRRIHLRIAGELRRPARRCVRGAPIAARRPRARHAPHRARAALPEAPEARAPHRLDLPRSRVIGTGVLRGHRAAPGVHIASRAFGDGPDDPTVDGISGAVMPTGRSASRASGNARCGSARAALTVARRSEKIAGVTRRLLPWLVGAALAGVALGCGLQTSGLGSSSGAGGRHVSSSSSAMGPGAGASSGLGGSTSGSASSSSSSGASSSSGTASSSGAASSSSAAASSASSSSSSASSSSSSASSSSSSASSSCGAGSTADFAGALAGDTPGAQWSVSADGHVAVTQSAGVVTFTSDGTQGKVSSYNWASGARSILGCEVSIEVPQVAPKGTTINAAFQFMDPNSGGQTHVGFAELGGALNFLDKENGSTAHTSMVPYDPNQHRDWRLRESGGTLFFETSSDAVTWAQQDEIEHAFLGIRGRRGARGGRGEQYGEGSGAVHQPGVTTPPVAPWLPPRRLRHMHMDMQDPCPNHTVRLDCAHGGEHGRACSDPPPPAAPLPPAPSAAQQPVLPNVAMLEAQVRQMLARAKFADAERAVMEAGRLYQQLRGPLHPDTGRLAELLASVELAKGNRVAAEKALLAALAAREAESGAGSPRVAEVLDRLGDVTRFTPDRAAGYLQRALAIRRAALGPDHPEVARTLVALGSVLLALCRAGDAEALLREALAIRERTAGAVSAEVVAPLEKLAEARWQVSDDAGYEQLLGRAAAVLDPLEATEAERLAHVLGELASQERGRKDYAAAIVHGERAVAVAERRLGTTAPPLVWAADGLAGTYRAQRNEAAATALFQRLSLVERVLPPGNVASAAPAPAAKPSAARCTPPGSRGSVANAATVVAGLAASFRRCYNRALQQDPEMKGTIRMIARIGAAGEVSRVRALTPASYAELMVTCPMQRLLEARFAPPDGGGATIVVPVTFVSQ